jgi:hypothetical protein
MNIPDLSNERITDRADLEGLTDDETILRTPEERAQQALRVTLIAVGLILFMIIATWILRPEGQIVVEHWPNGYTKTETTYRLDGRDREAHGPFRSWHENGRLLSEGQYVAGQPEGEWVFYGPDGERDELQSGTYKDDLRVGP